jgi:hypothetical protein
MSLKPCHQIRRLAQTVSPQGSSKPLGTFFGQDLMRALHALWHHGMCNLYDVNGALMVLLPKSSDASSLKQFRLISLIHSVGKLISKLLANRLAPRLSELVHPSQSKKLSGQYIGLIVMSN